MSEDSIRSKSRGDLVTNKVVRQGREVWIVKDPISLKYFELDLPEFYILQELRKACSYTQLRTGIAKRFPEIRVTKREIQSLLISFQTNGFLLTSEENLASSLRKHRTKQRLNRRLSACTNLFSIRFPGLYADRFLDWLYSKIQFVFSIWLTAIAGLLIASALLLVLRNFSEVYARFPSIESFFGKDNLLYLAVVLVITKTFHELGHGLMCKRFGAECPEIGFMLLFFAPAMYCETSDGWRLANRWQRMAIAAAGMYVELVLASLATFIWWYTPPNWLHFFCLNLMFVCSVSTLMFNANPLLRYDGYFILCDWLDIPNLATKANQLCVDKFRTWGLGMEPLNARLVPDRHPFGYMAFAISSFVYRLFMAWSIIWVAGLTLEPYGMKNVGLLAVMVWLLGMTLPPAKRLFQFATYPGLSRQVKWPRVAFTSCLFVALWIGLWIPLPYYVWAGFVIRPEDSQSVFVEQPGKIVRVHAKPGAAIKKGDLIVELASDDLKVAIEKLRNQQLQLESDFETLKLSPPEMGSVERTLNQIHAEIAKTKQQLEIRESQERHLRLSADRDGFVVPPPNIVASTRQEDRLERLEGTPFSAENAQAFLEKQTLVCYVSPTRRAYATLLIPEGDVKLIASKQSVQLLPKQFRNRIVYGTLSTVSSKDSQGLPRELSTTNGGFIAGELKETGVEKPMQKCFEAKVDLNESTTELLPGFFGQARIRVEDTSLAWRGYRYVCSLFNTR